MPDAPNRVWPVIPACADRCTYVRWLLEQIPPPPERVAGKTEPTPQASPA